MNGSSRSSRRAQFMVIGQRREQVSLHSFSPSLSLSLLFLGWHRVFSFTLLFFFFFRSSSSFGFERPSCVYILLRSITPCIIHIHTTSSTVLQCTIFSNITIMKMCLYICNSMQMRRKRVDLSSVLHMHVHVCIHKRVITSHNDRSTREYYDKTKTRKWILFVFLFFIK